MDEFSFYLFLAMLYQKLCQNPIMVFITGFFLGKMIGLFAHFCDVRKAARSFSPYYDKYKVVPYDWFWAQVNKQPMNANGFGEYHEAVKKL